MYKKYLIVLLFLASSVCVFSQNDTLYFPVTHHVFGDDQGNGIQPESMIPLIMQELNKAFAPARIQFYMSCVGIDTITIYNIFFKTIISQKKRIFNIEFNFYNNIRSLND